MERKVVRKEEAELDSHKRRLLLILAQAIPYPQPKRPVNYYDFFINNLLTQLNLMAGIQHGTQTQVQASEKGGLADAQANGPGPTSSQAQIGFTPHDELESDNQTTPFRGGGTAAAQSGTLSGMTQTQIQGKFRYGIRYLF